VGSPVWGSRPTEQEEAEGLRDDGCGKGIKNRKEGENSHYFIARVLAKIALDKKEPVG